ncbi:hypothetical protein KY285_037287 [Solanum tuberosum]|nr:hypothetical protein KY289_037503 [Solanum tuberosum]KAH0640701.1 hypothetical protein KY285_037287 [Solanum tuberosum]
MILTVIQKATEKSSVFQKIQTEGENGRNDTVKCTEDKARVTRTRSFQDRASCMSMSGNYGPPKPELEMIKLLHHAIDTGVTLLDTSDVYGPLTNEILIGKAIKGIREKLLIATKFGNRGICGEPAYVRACWEASLKRLDNDCIDTQLPIEVTVNPISLIVAYRAFPQVCHPKALLILGLIGISTHSFYELLQSMINTFITSYL